MGIEPTCDRISAAHSGLKSGAPTSDASISARQGKSVANAGKSPAEGFVSRVFRECKMLEKSNPFACPESPCET